jgi:hypothetical protein
MVVIMMITVFWHVMPCERNLLVSYRNMLQLFSAMVGWGRHIPIKHQCVLFQKTGIFTVLHFQFLKILSKCLHQFAVKLFP